MITTEHIESQAQALLNVAHYLGTVINDINAMAKEGWQGIMDEQQAYETIVLQGENVMVAMRTLAMRLDRAAIVKNEHY